MVATRNGGPVDIHRVIGNTSVFLLTLTLMFDDRIEIEIL